MDGYYYLRPPNFLPIARYSILLLTAIHTVLSGFVGGRNGKKDAAKPLEVICYLHLNYKSFYTMPVLALFFW